MKKTWVKGTKAEQTINSVEMSVAHAEWADSREWMQMTGFRPTVLIWVYDTGSSDCFLLKHESAVILVLIIIIYFLCRCYMYTIVIKERQNSVFIQYSEWLPNVFPEPQ